MLELDECSLPYESDPKLRSHSRLVEVVQKLGKRASGIASQLEIIDVPDQANWTIYTDADGREFVIDRDHVWGLRLPADDEKKE
jgi:hypothetical protein